MILPNFSLATTWIDLSLSIILGAFLIFVVYRMINRHFVLIYAIANFLLLVLSWLFNFQLLNTLLIIITIATITLTFFINISRIRPFILSAAKTRPIFSFRSSKKPVEKVFDRQAFYKKVKETVMALSKQKIGALLTFEKNMLLTEAIKTGTMVNAPFSAELVMTIFYPGTRLHDGAIVIRGNEILAASVYFTPTTKPLTGKYGSRHRAAIGVSELFDAVTVVVSEETGRISVAYRGELQTVTIDTFLRVFEESMLETLEDIN
ncbi:MAG: hypothetical protein GX132_02735 [Erysipelotrichia bacterium]|jgi:diadenylate cyclase|nr:hypothetical protein [Erysipelotrichia bacterium]